MPETTFESIAEWHLPNRVIVMSRSKIPLSEFLNVAPLRCHWCKREMPAKKLTVGPQLHLRCVDQKKCNKIHMENSPKPLRIVDENGKKKKKGTDGAKDDSKGSPDRTATDPGKSEGNLCQESHKIDGKKRKCRRKPGHKGKHRDVKGNRW